MQSGTHEWDKNNRRHLLQRGNNRQACFFADDDYRSYLNGLREYARQAGCAVHAYGLMTNQVHLLLTPSTVIGRA